MRKLLHIALSFLLVLSCGKDDVMVAPPEPDPEPEQPSVTPAEPDKPEEPPKPEEPAVIFPKNLTSLAKVYIDTPGRVGVTSKTAWVELATIRIIGDENTVLFEQDSLKIKGRGNSTWWNYPKKPYTIKLDHQADFFGTGKSKRYVLLANWMDRTLLRNDVAFEAARRTSLEWTPTGEFVELYLNGNRLGNYWLGEKINVEGSKFEADYLFSMDTSDPSETDFRTSYGFQPNSWKSGLPVEVKHPDRDEYSAWDFKTLLNEAQALVASYGKAIREGQWEGRIDLDSFCDWYLVHELCYNLEPNHPKSCYFHVRDGKLIAGPVWDFDWYTFIPDQSGLGISRSLYYGDLLQQTAFKTRLKERWKALKPEFQTLSAYVDKRADQIRSSETFNHQKWPCDSNPASGGGMVNGDERLTFQQAVDRLKKGLSTRISALDTAIDKL